MLQDEIYLIAPRHSDIPTSLLHLLCLFNPQHAASIQTPEGTHAKAFAPRFKVLEALGPRFTLSPPPTFLFCKAISQARNTPSDLTIRSQLPSTGLSSIS